MTGPSAQAFPGSRTLAGWWRQLLPYQPWELWVGRLFLHRVEATVRVHRRLHGDPLTLHILRALAFLERQAGGLHSANLAQLDEFLGLGSQAVRRLLMILRLQGLVEVATEKLSVSDQGRRLIEEGELRRTHIERHAFYFAADSLSTPGYVHLRQPETSPWVAGRDRRFNVELLRQCFGQSPTWKEQHGFPPEVIELVQNDADPSGSEPGDARAWRSVIVAYPVQWMAAFVLVAGNGTSDRLLGFSIRQENWALHSSTPVCALDTWRDTLPQFASRPSDQQWAQAWNNWCQPRGLPEALTEACNREHHGHLLKVVASATLIDHLRASRSDAIQGQAWILAGDGPIRKAAMLQLAVAKQERTAGHR
jgi:hypothetical protein